MSYAKYVGRVGALAVALGAGAWLGAPVAWADDASAGSASSSSSSSESTSTSESEATSSSEPADSEAESSAASEESGDSGNEGDFGEDVEEAEDLLDDSADDESIDDTEIDAPGSDDHEHSSESVLDEDDSPVEADVVTAEDVSVVDVPREENVTEDATSEVDVIADAPDNSAVLLEVPDVQQAPPSAESRSLVTASVPSGAPAEPVTLLTVLAWLRRTLVGPFYNRPPEATPVEIGEDADGDVIGTVGAFDPDGDPLTYTVTEAPKFGTLVVHSDGTFTYTPGVLLAEDGGEDSFTVEVRDVGFRLFSRPGVISVPVTVTVGAGDALGIGGSPYDIAISPDGRRAYVTDIDNNRVSVIHLASKAVIASIPVGKAPYGITIASDGKAYVVNSDDRTVTVIDTDTDSVIGDPILVGNSPTSVAVNADGTKAFVTNTNDDTLSIIDTTTFEVVTVDVGDNPFGVAVKGNRVYVTNEFDDTVSVIDTNTNAVIATVQVGDSPTGIAIGGNRAVVTNIGSSMVDGDGTVSIIDLETLTVVGDAIAVGDTPTDVVVDANGARAYVTDLDESEVSIIDLVTGELVGDPISTLQGAGGIAIGPDGSLYVAATFDGAVERITLETPAVAEFAAVPGNGPQGIVPDSTALARASARSVVAAAAADPNRATFTKGFDLHNLTTTDVTLVQFLGKGRPDNGVVPGLTLAPGSVLHFEIPATYFGDTEVQAVFSNAAGDLWTAKMKAGILLFGGVVGALRFEHTRGNGTSNPEPNSYWNAEANAGAFLEQPGTKILLRAGQPGPNSTLMNTLCASGQATCTFVARGTAVQTMSTPQRVDGAYINNTSSLTISETLKGTTTQSTRTNVENSAKLLIGAKDVFNVSLASKIGAEWTTSKSWEVSSTIPIPPKRKVWLEVSVPVWRVSGEIVIRVGNTTIEVSNVVVETPDTSPNRTYVKTIKDGPCDGCTA